MALRSSALFFFFSPLSACLHISLFTETERGKTSLQKWKVLLMMRYNFEFRNNTLVFKIKREPPTFPLPKESSQQSDLQSGSERGRTCPDFSKGNFTCSNWELTSRRNKKSGEERKTKLRGTTMGDIHWQIVREEFSRWSADVGENTLKICLTCLYALYTMNIE